MSINGVIFDLDQTLVNSKSIEQLRHPYQFLAIMGRIDEVTEYPGIKDLLFDLHQKNVKIGIVTSNVSKYCEKIIQRYNWVVNEMVCYHDVKKVKPDPEGIFLILEKLGISSENAVGIGDEHKDIIAYKSAGVYSIGALWGCKNPADLQKASPDQLCGTIGELRKLLIN